MAFNSEHLGVIAQPIGGNGIRIVSYRTDDAQDVVTSASYFTDATSFGLRESDVIFVSRLFSDAGPYVAVIETINDAGDGTAVLSDMSSYGIEYRASYVEAAADYHPVIIPEFIKTAGYWEAGDGGGALYKKVSSEPTHDGKLSITLGFSGTTVWYELAPENFCVDARQFGVIGDGATDGSATALKALSYMAEKGGNILFPQNCRLNTLVEIASTTTGFKIVGGSFIVNNSTGGIKITTSSAAHKLEISRTTFYAGIATSGRAFELIFGGATERDAAFVIDTVTCKPLVANNSGYRFTAAPRITNGWHGHLRKYFFNGAENNNITSCPGALVLDGTSTNVSMIDCHATNCLDGFVWGGASEGAKIVNTNAVAVGRGFVFEATPGDPNPQVNLIGCHTNATQRGVYSYYYNSVKIIGCLFYRFGLTAGYKDIEIVGASGHMITNNEANLGGDVENWFVHATDVAEMLVADNRLTGRWHHVQLEGNCKYVIARSNSQELLYAASFADELIDNTSVAASKASNKLLHFRAANWSNVTLNAASTTNNIPTGVATAITWNTTPNFDDQAGFLPASPTRISPPAWVKSIEVSASVVFASNATGHRLVMIRKNGSQNIAQASCAPADGISTCLNAAVLRVAHSPGDYYEVVVTQTSGGDLSVASGLTRFECRAVS